MSDLTEFLLARIAEDEAAVRSRDPQRPIHHVGCYYYENTLDANLYCDCDPDGSASRPFLAECEAKRRIVSLASWEGRKDSLRNWVFGPAANVAFQAGIAAAVRNLALVYADHPDYRDEWRP